MPFFTDQTGRTIEVENKPVRIVSLVPFITELLHHLGLEKEVTGITKFCVHPPLWHQIKTKIGGTKNLHLSTIQSLQPQLIIASKEENVQEQVAALWHQYPTSVSDVADFSSALEMIEQIGLMAGKAAQANQLADDIEKAFADLSLLRIPLKTAYLIWREPFMTVGGDTYIHHMMQHAGLQNAFADKLRYPVVTIDDLKSLGCSLILLSSEPYPFQEKHRKELAQLLPEAKVLLVDGEMFSWYGSRMLLAPAYFKQMQQQIDDVFPTEAH